LETEATAHLKLRPAAAMEPPHEVARDPKQPGDRLLVFSTTKPFEAYQRLRERFRRQVRGGRAVRCLRLQPALYRDRVTAIELTERLRISPRGDEQLNIASIHPAAIHTPKCHQSEKRDSPRSAGK
jgi:hypothetical protein